MRLNPIVFPAGFLALFLGYPYLRVLEASSAEAWRWMATPYVQERVWGAVLQATLSTLAVFAIALPLAFLYHRRSIPGARGHLALHAAPFVLPVFVIIHGTRGVFGQGGLTEAWFGVDVLAVVGPLGTIVLAHTYYNYGLAARLVHAHLTRRPQRLEEAAQVLGASPWRARLVSVRLLLPAMGGVALLVWLFCFTSFGVVLLMGGGKQATMETLLYHSLGGVFPRTDRAAALGIVQLIINVGLLAGFLALQKRRAWNERVPTPARAGRATVAGALLALALLPAASVLAGGFRVQGRWTFDAWRALIDADHPAHFAGFELGTVVLRTAALAAGSMVVSLLLAVTFAYGLHRAGRLRRAGELLAALPLGTSSVLLGFGYLISFGAGSLLDLRGQFVGIVIVHALVGFPFVVRTLLPALDAIPARLGDAAATLGAGPADRFLSVRLAMVRPALLAAAGFAAAMSLGDFGASLLLMDNDTLSLALWIDRLDAPFRPLLHAQSVALTGLLMALAAGAIVAVERGGSRWT